MSKRRYRTVEEQTANWHPDVRRTALDLYAKAMKAQPAARVPKIEAAPMLRERRPDETGPWTVEIPGWCPPSLNRLLEMHPMARWRTKKHAEEVIAEACKRADIPRASERRRVSVAMTLPAGRRQQDEDNPLKVLRDGLKRCGALVDDKRKWCQTGDYPEAKIGPLMTTIVLEAVE